MDIFIASIVLAVLAETTYITYKLNTKHKQSMNGAGILMDTSALIDGRILAIARSGFITAPLVVPKSVIAELQYMADRADHDKRERARFGLDTIEALQQLDDVFVQILNDDKPTDREVDEQLVQLAQQYGAKLCTIDYNLNKAARVQNIHVVNINELSHALRIVHLPGETTRVKIVQPGQEARQGVGYLDDGTMVVVDDAKGRINDEVEVVITRALQTAAGKMMFARLASPSQKAATKHERQPQKKRSADNRKRTSQRLSPQARAESKLVELANKGE